MQVDTPQGLMGPICVLLFILPAAGSLAKILSTKSEMSPLNPSHSNKKLHPHVRWEPIEIPTKKKLSGRAVRTSGFSPCMQNTAFQGRGELWKRVNKLVL